MKHFGLMLSGFAIRYPVGCHWMKSASNRLLRLREVHTSVVERIRRVTGFRQRLMRRVVKGMELYRINNIVDLVNLVSLESGMSIGGYDADKIAGSAILSIGKEGEPYEAIGRGELNIAGLPVFRDNVSAFGSPTSDSVRTSVTNETCRFLMVIVGFIGQSETEKVMRRSVGLLQQYGFAAHIEQRIVV